MYNKIAISIVAGAVIIGGVTYTYFSNPQNIEEEQVNQETCEVVFNQIQEARNFSEKTSIARKYLELGCRNDR